MLLKRIDSIGRAARLVAAMLSKIGANEEAIALNQKYHEAAYHLLSFLH